jgi:hypothetical protein
MSEKKHITLDDLLNKVNDQTKDFIGRLEREEELEKVESLEAIENEIKLQQFQTELNKKKFANTIVNGLGKQLKENPNKVKKIEKTKWQKFKEIIKKIFTKF